MLYALLARHPPFTEGGAAAILNQHANIAPTPLRAENDRVSPALEAVVMQMLAKSPDDRPQTAAQVRDRLTNPSANPPVTPAATAPLRQTTATQPLPEVVRPDRRRLILAGALAALGLTTALVALASGGSSPHPTTSTRRGTTAAKATTPPKSSSTTATTSHTATSTPTTSSSRTAQPSTVSGTAGALTALTAQDVQSGTIDQQAAQQMTNALSGILNSYTMGRTTDAQHKLTDLTQHVATLEQQGHITSAAAPALNTAVANLSTAIGSAPLPTSQTPGGQPPAKRHGPGGQPPGQAKHKKPKGH